MVAHGFPRSHGPSKVQLPLQILTLDAKARAMDFAHRSAWAGTVVESRLAAKPNRRGGGAPGLVAAGVTATWLRPRGRPTRESATPRGRSPHSSGRRRSDRPPR